MMGNNTQIIEIVSTGLLVAMFLRKTGRALHAIELCKECLMLLSNNTARSKDNQIAKAYCAIYSMMYSSYIITSDYTNAEKYGRKLLVMFQESGNTYMKGKICLRQAQIYHRQGRLVEARKLFETVIEIKKANGDKQEEADAYKNLGHIFTALGEYQKAEEYIQKALNIYMEINDKEREAGCYSSLGTVITALGKYKRANDYYQIAQRISMQIGSKEGEARSYGDQANLSSALGDNKKAVKYLEKELAFYSETGNRERQAGVYHILGRVLKVLGEYTKAEEYYEKAYSLSSDMGDIMIEFASLAALTMLSFKQSKYQEGNSYLSRYIQKFEDMLNFNNDNDQFKIALLENMSPYKSLSAMFSSCGNPQDAFYVEELGRARVLADLMANQYSVPNQISTDPQSWSGLENIIKNERNCTCLYLSYINKCVFHWVIKKSGDFHFRRKAVKKETLRAEFAVNLDGLFNKSFRNFGILPRRNCEDRSLDDTAPMSSQDESRVPLRGKETPKTEESLHYCYKLIIAPVADLLTEPEILIVPDRSMYRVPFAGLRDEPGKEYLSEKFRIRIVPSLTTLKLIQDIPAENYGQTRALIVGDPKVGMVLFKGKHKDFDVTPLACARKEAEMIGRLLGVPPLLGEQATKQAVLEAMNAAHLIHFAAHGNAERGEIALSPDRATGGIPQEEDYLLTMYDIAKVQLQAKLVVLSCCHSGRGQIKQEGVVGIARAFLGSGTRSVLVALWALDDIATEQLMIHFYKHLVGGESASESLHQAMKWMRNNGFTKVSDWAPFMLIGDNVTFDFSNIGMNPLSANE